MCRMHIGPRAFCCEPATLNNLGDWASNRLCLSWFLLQLPPPALLARWSAEPVKALLVGTDCFTLNKRGYPVLSKAHQDFIALMFTFNVQVGLVVGQVMGQLCQPCMTRHFIKWCSSCFQRC